MEKKTVQTQVMKIPAYVEYGNFERYCFCILLLLIRSYLIRHNIIDFIILKSKVILISNFYCFFLL